MDINKLVTNEAAWLAKQEARTRQKLINLYKESFAEMEAKLKSQKRDSYSRRHTRAIAAQLDAILQETSDRQADVLGKDVQLTFEKQLFRERDAWSELEKAFGTVKAAHQFEAIQPAVTGRAVKPLLAAQQVAIKGFNSDLSKAVRNEVAKSMLAGEGMKKTTRRLKQIKDAPKNEARLHLISRMEHARASNAGKQEFIQQVNQEHPGLELWQMIKGRVDTSPKTRNHWFTWAINGTVRNVTKDEYFEVHHAAIAQAKIDYTTKTHRKASDSGILWKKFDKGRRSKKIPSHFHDRDVIVAWRPSWGTVAGPVKHPQGEPKKQPDFSEDISDIPQIISTSPSNPDIIIFQPDKKVSYNDLNQYQKEVLHHNQQQLKLPKDQRREMLNVWRKDGFPIDTAKGDVREGQQFVDFNVSDELLTDSFASHNHLSGTALSGEDFETAIQKNMNHVDAIGEFKEKYYIYEINRSGPEWPEELKSIKFSQAVKQLKNQLVFDNLNRLINLGYDRNDAEIWAADMAVREVCRAYNIEYQVKEIEDVAEHVS